MYKLSGKLKLFSIIIMVLGLIGMAYGFLTVPKTVEDVQKILASQEEGHGEGHAVANEEAHETSFVDEARGEKAMQKPRWKKITHKRKRHIMTIIWNMCYISCRLNHCQQYLCQHFSFL